MHSHKSLPRLILAGLILSAVPAASLARQSFSTVEPIHISLPIEFSKTAENIRVITSINCLNLSNLAGDKNISIGDAIYVHLNLETQSAAQNSHALRYVYAVTQNRPPRSDDLTVSVRGIVTDRDDNIISVQYQFEDSASRSAAAKHISSSGDGVLVLAIDRRAVGHVISIIIDGKTIGIR